jgi:hypothetical protein
MLPNAIVADSASALATATVVGCGTGVADSAEVAVGRSVVVAPAIAVSRAVGVGTPTCSGVTDIFYAAAVCASCALSATFVAASSCTFAVCTADNEAMVA